MHADNPWPRPDEREMNPLWIAACILAVLFVGYQIAVRYLPSRKPPAADRPPATAAPSPLAPAPRSLPPATRDGVQEATPPATEPAPPTREIYLCKGYGGGMFWSSAICSTQRATIDRIVTVPTSLSWDQQVQFAEGRRQEAQALYEVPQHSPAAIGSVSPGSARPTECHALEMRIQQLDAMARQPQSGATQDWIRGERQVTRSRQAALRC